MLLLLAAVMCFNLITYNRRTAVEEVAHYTPSHSFDWDTPPSTTAATISNINKNNNHQQSPLPWGRDQPLHILQGLPPGFDRKGGGGGTLDISGQSGQWEAGLAHFPCSLSEEDEYRNWLDEGKKDKNKNAAAVTAKVPPVSTRTKPRVSGGPCVISCETEFSGEQDQNEERQQPSPPPRGSLVAGGSRECERGIKVCELLQECTHVVLSSSSPPLLPSSSPPPLQQHPKFAVLMHKAREDASLEAIKAAASARWTGEDGGWAATGGFSLNPQARRYYVVSFGGSGSKMLGGWLSERGRRFVKEVFHIHDPNPAKVLFSKDAKRGVRRNDKDFRGYSFPEGDFPSKGTKVENIDSYRVVFIFKDPAEALVSRYFYNHCKNLRGADCGGSEKEFPSLERYAEEEEDRLHMETFYDNYCGSTDEDKRKAKLIRNYPVVCINYHKIWDNSVAVVRALGLPESEASKLPTRTETIRNDWTSAARGEPFTLAVRERLRKKHASLSEKIFEAPAVSIV